MVTCHRVETKIEVHEDANDIRLALYSFWTYLGRLCALKLIRHPPNVHEYGVEKERIPEANPQSCEIRMVTFTERQGQRSSILLRPRNFALYVLFVIETLATRI